MWKKCFAGFLLTVLTVGMINWNPILPRPSESSGNVRIDGFTNDTNISSTKYPTNQHTYHSIFQMGLAGPGLTTWDYAMGAGVNVAIMDGGADVKNRELEGNIKGCYNAVTREEGATNISNNNHGTACAKILGAVGNNQNESAGVAYGANLYIIQVDANGTQASYSKSVIEGIRYAISKHCRVISLSLSDTVYDASMEAAIEQVYAKSNDSVLFVASGGNTGKQEYRYPSSYENVLSVSALNYSAKNTAYTIASSTYNNRIDAAAPGGTTSAATPYVAGVAALIFQMNPSLTAAECADIITSTAKDAGSKGYDQHYGYGIIQPLAAVQKAKFRKSFILRSITGTTSYKKAYGSKTFKLNAKATGSGVLTYKSSNTKVASVSNSGYIKMKDIGKATIGVSVPKSGIYSSTSRNITITVTPKRPTVTLKNIKKRRLKISWKKDRKVSGYVIYTATNSKFKKQKKYTRKKSSSSITISKLKKKKQYWIRIKSYKIVGGKRIYSDDSKVKKIRIKK